MATESHLDPLAPGDAGSEALGAWFVGAVGENGPLLCERVAKAVADHIEGRKQVYAGDPPWADECVMASDAYGKAKALLTAELDCLSARLKGSVPFFSYRYQGHMLWDISLPGLLGYFAAMLYNQNNVAAEASPVTMGLEEEVAVDLRSMLGYPVNGSWGHITCDGSVANMEALWAARNLKAYPQAVVSALREEPYLSDARGISVELADGTRRPLLDLDPWELANLRADDVLALPRRIEEEYGIAPEHVDSIKGYTLQRLGIAGFLREHPTSRLDRLVVLGPATAHYSLAKGASLLGLGENAFIRVPVDADARMSLPALRSTLDRQFSEQRPVAAVVAVLGTTEESAVDPLAAILDLREQYRRQGCDFLIHVDAAWGGYFVSLVNDPPGGSQAADILKRATAGLRGGSPQEDPTAAAGMLADTAALLEGLSDGDGRRVAEDVRQARVFTPPMTMSGYVEAQYRALRRADSITVDPHKAGYIPYPAGALCYRNAAMSQLVAFTAHVVYHTEGERALGLYGIEGSKPGAAPAAVWLSHKVIRPDQSGYGRILGRCMFNSKRLYAALVTLPSPGDRFVVSTVQRLPAERRGAGKQALAEELKRIRFLAGLETNQKLWDHLRKCEEDADLFRELGSDQIIVAYAFNFRRRGEDRLNTDVKLANALNHAVFERLSLDEETARGCGPGHKPKPPLIITHSKFDPEVYGPEFVSAFMGRLGLEGPPATVDFLISTTMDPWLTDTAGDHNMIPELMDSLRDTVRSTVEEIERSL